MSKKLIELHFEWMETGYISGSGLCNSIPEEYEEYFDVVRPNDQDKLRLSAEGTGYGYWGNDSVAAYRAPMGDPDFESKYNERRQSLVLMVCAMAGEI